MKSFSTLLALLFSIQSFSQAEEKKDRIERPPMVAKTTTFTSTTSFGYARSEMNELYVNAGLIIRNGTCGCVGCIWTGVSISPGYNYMWKNDQFAHVGELIIEPRIFALAAGLGTEIGYQYDFTNNNQHIRPALNINFAFLELSYGYSFNLNPDQKDLGHRLGIRVKFQTISK